MGDVTPLHPVGLTVYCVMYRTCYVLVRAHNEREAVSIVRDRIDRMLLRKLHPLSSADDFTCHEATPAELTLMADQHPSRIDQGVLSL